MSKPESQSINIHEGINAHGAMGESEQEQPAPPPLPNDGEIPADLMAEAKKQVDGGAAFFGKHLKDCTREELYAATIAGWYDAQAMRAELDRLQRQMAEGNPPNPAA